MRLQNITHLTKKCKYPVMQEHRTCSIFVCTRMYTFLTRIRCMRCKAHTMRTISRIRREGRVFTPVRVR